MKLFQLIHIKYIFMYIGDQYTELLRVTLLNCGTAYLYLINWRALENWYTHEAKQEMNTEGGK